MSILDTIVEQKKREVAKLPARFIAAGDLRDALLEHGERRDFLAALQHPRHGDIALIAEVKKASPSAGVICQDFDPVRIAKEYEAAGASCLSVLTDEKFFQGSLDYLRQIRAAVKLPLLRKDFIIDERQILEAIEWGADAILLIVAILSDEQLKKFHSLAMEAGLAALVEAQPNRPRLNQPRLDQARPPRSRPQGASQLAEMRPCRRNRGLRRPAEIPRRARRNQTRRKRQRKTIALERMIQSPGPLQSPIPAM